MFGLLLGLSLGIAIGAWFGRREGRKEVLAQFAELATLPGAAPAVPPVAATPAPPPPFEAPSAPSAPAPVPAAVAPIGSRPPPSAAVEPPPPPIVPPIVPPEPARLPPLAAPNKKARKKGLTEADFRPRDDILVRMQDAWARGEHLAPDPAGGPGLDPGLDDRMARVLARLEGTPPGQGAPTMPQDPAPEAAPGGETVSEVVNELAALGYGDDLRFDDGVLSCRRCGGTHESSDADVEHVRRFEGQSDPADEAIILALRCPHCGAGGVLVSPYGPDADPALAEAFTYLAERAGHG